VRSTGTIGYGSPSKLGAAFHNFPLLDGGLDGRVSDDVFTFKAVIIEAVTRSV